MFSDGDKRGQTFPEEGQDDGSKKKARLLRQEEDVKKTSLLIQYYECGADAPTRDDVR